MSGVILFCSPPVLPPPLPPGSHCRENWYYFDVYFILSVCKPLIYRKYYLGNSLWWRIVSSQRIEKIISIIFLVVLLRIVRKKHPITVSVIFDFVVIRLLTTVETRNVHRTLMSEQTFQTFSLHSCYLWQRVIFERFFFFLLWFYANKTYGTRK